MSIESRIEKLEASKPINAAAEAAIVMRRVQRACVGLTAEEADRKMHAIFKYLPDAVLEIIANMKDDDGSGDETPDLPPPPPTNSPQPTLQLQESPNE